MRSWIIASTVFGILHFLTTGTIFLLVLIDALGLRSSPLRTLFDVLITPASPLLAHADGFWGYFVLLVLSSFLWGLALGSVALLIQWFVGFLKQHLTTHTERFFMRP